MESLTRAQQICECLERAGVRATTDPALIDAPAVLVLPPNRTYDLSCGFTARWQLIALAPAAQTGDRTSWALLDGLVAAACSVLDIESADLVAYIANGRSYPSYLMQFEEAIA